MLIFRKDKDVKPTKILRDMLRGSECYIVPGVYNPFTALLVERQGFKAAYLSGAALTGSLAIPDLGLLTLNELSFFTRLITSVVNIPLIVDADTGFGEVLNVMRTVKELENAGAAAVQIEDQEMPKKCGHLSGKRVVEPQEMARKITAACDARRDEDFIVIARVDSRDVYGFEDAVERAKLYLEAGADVIFPEALRSEYEFREFASRVNAPLLANMTEFGKTPYITAEQFKEMGYKLVVFPVTLFRASAKISQKILRKLHDEGTQKNMLNELLTRQEFYDIIEYKLYEELDSIISSKQFKFNSQQ